MSAFKFVLYMIVGIILTAGSVAFTLTFFEHSNYAIVIDIIWLFGFMFWYPRLYDKLSKSC